MKVIEWFKNRETKKKLKEENIRLHAEIETIRKTPVPVCTVERNIQQICFQRKVGIGEREVPDYIIKEQINRGLMDEIKHFVEYDFFDTNYGERHYTGTIYVATGDRKI